MVGDAGEAGPVEAVLAGLADGVASSLVFVVGGDVAEGGVQAAGVVVVNRTGFCGGSVYWFPTSAWSACRAA